MIPKRIKNMWKKAVEKVDSTPHALPVKGLRKPLTLEDQIARALRFQRAIEKMNVEGHETFEEANDFEIPDEPDDPQTPWEENYVGQFDKEVEMERALYEQDPKSKEKWARVRRASSGKKQASGFSGKSVRNNSEIRSGENDVHQNKNDLQTVSDKSGKQQQTVHNT